MSRRRGVSIIETMLVVVLTSVVSGIVMSLLVLLHRCDRHAQEELTNDIVLARLEIQLRHDMHRAQIAQLNDHTLTLQRSTDRSVEYFFDSEGLHRQVH